MLKKVLAGTFLMAFIVTNGVTVYADNTDFPDKAMPIVNIEDDNIVNVQGTEDTSEVLEKKPDNDKENILEQDMANKTKNVKKVEIFEPKDRLITTDKVLLLSGKGVEGTRVLIEVYSIPELTKSNFDFDSLPEDSNYYLSLDKIIKIGPSGVFGEELELKQGLNKIIIYIVEETNDEVNEEEVNEEEVSEEEVSEEEVSEEIINEEVNEGEVNEEVISEDEEANQEMEDEQNNEGIRSDTEIDEEDNSIDEESISEDIEKTKIIEKYVYIQDITQAKENLDSIKKPGLNPGLDIPPKQD